MSTAARFAIENETAREHVSNALQILMQSDDAIDELDLAAVRDRLQRALVAIDGEANDPIARVLLQAKEAERLDLVEELQSAHSALARFEYVRATIGIPWKGTGGEEYNVFTVHHREEGRFTREQWHAAVALRNRIREDAVIAAVKAAPTEPTPQRPQLVGGRAD